MADEPAPEVDRRARRRRALRRAGRWGFAGVVLVATVPLLTLLVAVWTNGWSVRAVRSGSMEPYLRVGSAVVVAQVDPGDVEVGTVIAFTDPNDPRRTVVHRVRRVVERNGLVSYETQGDANAAPDRDLVPQRLVQGEVVRHLVGLGAVVEWAGRRRNAAVLLVAPLALLGANELLRLWQRRRSRAEQREIRALRARLAELELALSAPPGD